MGLINFKHREDFGHEWYVQLLNVKGWSLLQASVSWNDYPVGRCADYRWLSPHS